MAGTGLYGSLGIMPEATYGTYVAPTRFFEPKDSAEVKFAKNVAQGGGLAAGRLGQPSPKRVVTHQWGTGSANLELTRTGLGVLLQHIMGGTAVPVQQAATSAYLQAHVLGDNVGKSLSVQIGAPEATAAGAIRPLTGRGGKILSAEFSCGVGEVASLALEFDFQRRSETETLAAPSFVSRNLFHFAQMAVKVGAPGAEVAIGGVKKASVKIERPQDTERFYAGAQGLKGEPLGNDFVKVTGSLDFDFIDKTIFNDRYVADAAAGLVIEWVGPIIAATHAERLSFKMPAAEFEDEISSLDGAGILTKSIPFTALVPDAGSMLTAEYMSTDTAL